MKNYNKGQLKAMGILFVISAVALFGFLGLQFVSPIIGWLFLAVSGIIIYYLFKKNPMMKSLWEAQVASNAQFQEILHDALQSPEEKRKRKEAAYRDILSHLPSDLMRKIHKLLGTAGLKMGLPAEKLPDELCYALAMANAVIESDSYGTINEAQRLKIEELIKGFEWQVETGIPAYKQAVNSLYGSDGLGFGLITNSAASAGLYAAMNAHDKIKGHEQRIREFKQYVDREVVDLLNGIQQALSEDSEMSVEESPVKKAPTKENPTSGISAADEIQKFKELLDAGAITQEEFEAKKKQLLGV